MKNYDFKPCPFCGSTDLVFRPAFRSDEVERDPEIGCNGCGFYMRGKYAPDFPCTLKALCTDPNQTLADRWNMRPEKP